MPGLRPAGAGAPPAPATPGTTPGMPTASPGLMRALGFLPYLTAVIALFVPLAAGLYLATTVVWTLGQRMLLRRRFPLPVPPAAAA